MSARRQKDTILDRPATKPQTPLSPVSILAALISPAESELPALLPIADAEIPALLAAGVVYDDGRLGEHVDKVAAAGSKGYAESLRRANAWHLQATAPESDPIESVLTHTRDAAFALGLALGLRIGGAR